METIRDAVDYSGNIFTRRNIRELQDNDYSANQIAKIQEKVGNSTDKAKTLVKSLLDKEENKKDKNLAKTIDDDIIGSSIYNNPINPAALTKTYGFSPDAFGIGMTADFRSSLLMPKGDDIKLTRAEQIDARTNRDNAWNLYQETQLTNLRGQISKELAQLYNMTEIGKSKIAAQSAMDTTRETGMQNFRQNLRQSYAGSLMNFFS